MVRSLPLAIALIALVYSLYKDSAEKDKEETWPAWMKWVGDYDVPHIVSSGWFFWFAWISRRVLPFVLSVTVMSLWSYMAGSKQNWGLPAPDWLALLVLTCGCFIAYIPFAKRPRRYPVDKWMGMIMGLGFIGLGTVASLIAVFSHFFPAAARHSALWHFAAWTSSSRLSDSLGLGGSIVGFGIAMVGMVETLPKWDTGVFAVDNSAELESLRRRNQELESELHQVRRKLKSYNRQRHH
jgi:hypothetical protein